MWAVFLVQIFSGANFPVTVLPKWLLPIALALPLTYGFDAIRCRIAELAEYTRQAVGEGVGLRLASSTAPSLSGAMTAFECPPGVVAAQLRHQLWAQRVEIPIIERPDRLLVRVSHHFYTTEAEIDYAVARIVAEVERLRAISPLWADRLAGA